MRLASAYGRYGYRRITALLRGEGWHVNHKRVERIWRREGLKVPAKQPKRGRLWLNDGSCIRLRAAWPNHVWSYDFVMDRTHDGRAFRMLTVIDEFTRECLAIPRRAQAELGKRPRLYRGPVRQARRTRSHPFGQWVGVHRPCRPGVVGPDRREDALYRTRQPLAERLQRVIQRQTPRRDAQRRNLLLTPRGPSADRAMVASLQHGEAAQRAGLQAPGATSYRA